MDSIAVSVPAYSGSPITLPPANISLISHYGDIQGKVISFHGSRMIDSATIYLKSVNFKLVGNMYVMRDTTLDSVTTIQNGAFFFQNKDKNRFLSLVATCENYKETEPLEVQIEGGDTVEYVIPMWISSGIIGNITDTVSRRPISSAVVDVYAKILMLDNGQLKTIRVKVDSLIADSTGVFSSPLFTTGSYYRSYEITVSASGYLTKTITGITFNESNPEYVANVALSPLNTETESHRSTKCIIPQLRISGKTLMILSQEGGVVHVMNIRGQKLLQGKSNSPILLDGILANNQVLFIVLQIKDETKSIFKIVLME
jgi:hypothetical protein